MGIRVNIEGVIARGAAEQSRLAFLDGERGDLFIGDDLDGVVIEESGILNPGLSGNGRMD